MNTVHALSRARAPVGPPRWLRTPGAALAIIGTAILPGRLLTNLYDLALVQRLPRGLSVTVAPLVGGSRPLALVTATG